MAQLPLFNLFFSWAGLALWVVEFVGFIIIFICFPTPQNSVNRKHRKFLKSPDIKWGAEPFVRVA